MISMSLKMIPNLRRPHSLSSLFSMDYTITATVVSVTHIVYTYTLIFSYTFHISSHLVI